MVNRITGKLVSLKRCNKVYLINKQSNFITQVPQKTFAELGFREKENLQEWLANNPEALGEELLIIQKEFSGFSDTKERLDLLALDKLGNLVIIENKLDDTGKDVTWQVLKYASYCSTLSKKDIKEIYQDYLDKTSNDESAEENLVEFFNESELGDIQLNKGQTQRIIMVSGNFRKEVTSTVLWLMNYKLRIQCFKVTPYALEDQLFLDIEQIIPMKDTEDYIISMADKTQEDITTQDELKERHYMRIEFWKLLLSEMNKKSALFQNINPTKDHWLIAGAGMSNVGFSFSIGKNYARTEVHIARPIAEENKFIYDELYELKETIEAEFGEPLEWERLDDIKVSRIKNVMRNVNSYDKEEWEKMITFMVDSMVRVEKAFKSTLGDINQKLKTQGL